MAFADCIRFQGRLDLDVPSVEESFNKSPLEKMLPRMKAGPQTVLTIGCFACSMYDITIKILVWSPNV